MTWKARFLWAFLVSIGLTVLLALTAIVFPRMSHQDEIFVSVLLFAMHALAALVGAVLWQRKRARRMVYLGVGALVAGGLMWIGLVWADEFDLLSNDAQKFLARVAATLTVPGLVFLLRAVLLWPESRGAAVRSLARLGWFFGACAGAVFLSAIWPDKWWGPDDFLVRTILASLTLSAGCSLSVFIVARLTKGDLLEQEDSPLGVRAPVRLDCPRCGEPVELKANTPGKCPNCDLKLRVEFEEPRCSCGYLLHGLTGDVCPECGRPIERPEGWTPRGEASPNPPLSDREPAPRSEGD